jgi:DNA-binding NarL/FixJ family response regulator
MSTTLIVADDHPLLRAALREAISHVLPESRIIEAACAAEVERAALNHPDADLILLDLYMPDTRGFSALTYLRAHHPSIPVAMISVAESQTIVRRAIDLGASGFIPKSASIEHIGLMLRALLRGEIVVPPDYLPAPEENESEAASALQGNLEKLTPQQRRVLLLLADGTSNRMIAEKMGVSESTIKAHVSVILRKLGLERRTQAALLAQNVLRIESADEKRIRYGRGRRPRRAARSARMRQQ